MIAGARSNPTWLGLCTGDTPLLAYAMFWGDGVIVGSLELGLSMPNVEKIRPEGLGELRKEIRPVGLAGMINIVMLLGTKWYTRLLVTGKPFV